MQTQIKKLASGNQGTIDTLRHMADFVRRDVTSMAVREFAEDLVCDCGGHDTSCDVRTVFNYVRNAIKFQRDPIDLERVSGARGTLERGLGDCDDKSVLLATLLASLGYLVRFKVITFDNVEWNHVYVEVLEGSKWTALDPTNERARVGWEGTGRTATYEIWPSASGGIGAHTCADVPLTNAAGDPIYPLQSACGGPLSQKSLAMFAQIGINPSGPSAAVQQQATQDEQRTSGGAVQGSQALPSVTAGAAASSTAAPVSSTNWLLIGALVVGAFLILGK